MTRRIILAFDVIDDNGNSILTDEMYPNALDIPISGHLFDEKDCFNIHMALWNAMNRVSHYDDFKHLFPSFNLTELGEEVPNDNLAHKFGHTTFEYSPTRMRFLHHNKDDQIFPKDNSLHECFPSD